MHIDLMCNVLWPKTRDLESSHDEIFNVVVTQYDTPAIAGTSWIISFLFLVPDRGFDLSGWR